jgi:hypothetical protein
VRVGICVGDGGCASWVCKLSDQVRVVKFGFSSWGGQVCVVKLSCAGQSL